MKLTTKLFTPLIVLSMSLFFFSCNNNKVDKVTISASEKTLLLGETDTLTATPEYSGDIVPSVQWSSSNTSIVTVSSAGVIGGISKGTATVTAKAGDKTATCTVTVTNTIATSFNEGYLFYFGDYYATGKSNNYQVYLINGSTADTAVIEFNTDTVAKTYLPVGTYSMVSSPDYTFTEFAPFTLVAADYTYNFGSWYATKTIFTGLEDGYATISTTDNYNTYSIVYELSDSFGNIISGEYDGYLYYFDLSTLYSAPGYVKMTRSLPQKLKRTSAKFIK